MHRFSAFWLLLFTVSRLASSSIVVVLDGAASRVQETCLRSIVEHISRPLSAKTVATWQGTSLGLGADYVKQRYGIDAVVEPDVDLVQDIATWQSPRLVGRTVFYNAYTRFRAYERVKRLKFQWLVYTRSDMQWLAQVPPAALWNDSRVVWIPDYADWGGVYDRAALIPRRFAESFFQGPFKALLSKPLLRTLFQDDKVVTSESLLFRVLQAAGAKVGSFPPLGAIRRCQKELPECRDHLLAEDTVEGFAEWRYFHEFVDASYAALHANVPGRMWARTTGRRDLNPGCWFGGFGQDCCIPGRIARGGCFDSSNFYTARKCCGFTPYLTIAMPDGHQACWSLTDVHFLDDDLSDIMSKGDEVQRAILPLACLPIARAGDPVHSGQM